MHKVMASGRPLIMVKEAKNEDTEQGHHHSKDYTIVKPPDQLVLTEEELEEDHVRVLNINNPTAPHNIVRYSFKERTFKQIPYVDQTFIHLDIKGNLINKDTEEARQYESQRKQNESARKNFYIKSLVDEYVDEEGNIKYRILKNDFNFCDRASQTFNNPCRDLEMMTEPPLKETFSGQVDQYIIFMAYAEHHEQTMSLQKSKKSSIRANFELERIRTAKQKRLNMEQKDPKGAETFRLLMSTKLIERMICQNQYDEVINDFKYYDDISDGYRKEGSLLPLWKFSDESTKNLCVTGLSWNPKYADFFAVSCGSYDFLNSSKGVIILYSLKNPSFFETKIITESGCMCIDFHPDHSYLIAAGFYDGTVNVFDIRIRASKKPKFKSEVVKDRHRDPVWQVQWQADDLDGNLNFSSVSSDGRLINWTIKGSELLSRDIAVLDYNEVVLEQEGKEANIEKTPENKVERKEDVKAFDFRESGTCFDSNTKQDDIFIIGTENGKIFEYSRSHLNCLLTTYSGHSMPIYAIKWNTFLKRVFITCSADWTIKIWDNNYKDEILKFDVNAPVSDVAWSPYSSTVFAAVTLDGYVYIYDIAINKYEPLCRQNILNKKKRKLTRVAFNPHHYILLVSDDRGNVFSLKLSPNLRSVPKDAKNNPISILNKFNFELTKISKLISNEAEGDAEHVKTTRKFSDIEEISKQQQSGLQSNQDGEQKTTSKKVSVKEN